MTQINWGILGGGVDPGAAFQQAYQSGRVQAKAQATDDVLSRYAAAPSADALAPLAALDPQAFGVLSKNERERAEVARTAQGRQLGAGFLRERYSQPDALSPGVAPVSPASETGDIVVTARPRPRPVEPTISVADVYEADPGLAGNIIDYMGKLDKQGSERLADQYAGAAAVAQGALGVPVDQRQAYIENHRDYLRDVGWKDEEIDGLEPTDEALNSFVAIGLGADKYHGLRHADATLAETTRGRRASEARQDRSERRTAYYQGRADRRSQVRFGERALDRAALTGVRTDTDDLEY